MFFEDACRKCWNCPTDRELRLRSKLNSGWSVHTANMFRKVESIPSEELEAIESVIRRAKDLEQLETERVGRMLCRLENMTRNALGGDGEKTCSMCGTEDGLFQRTFVNCFDCSKAVCEKCRVDTVTVSTEICMLCKICSENREVWKKSGGWFYGRFPTMTEKSQKECTALTSNSPGNMLAFDTWAHRAPDIVRLESYQPPEENRNDNSLYKDWTMNLSTPDLNSLDEDEGDDHTNKLYIELASFRKSYPNGKESNLNHLTVQVPKLSSSCPSLNGLKEEHKLKRKPSIRRKGTSATARKIMKKIANKIN